MTFRDLGVVLKVKGLRDADRHYTIFTAEHGKIVVLAKGSRRGKSKLSPHLGSFGVVDVMVAKGKIIDRLAGAALVRPHKTVIASLEKTALVQAFLLAVDAMTKRELPEERIFRLIVDFLGAVDASPASAGGRSPLFDAAVVKLMDVLGFGVDLAACVRCRAPLVPEGNAVDFLAGGIQCGRCRHEVAAPVSADAIKALRFFQRESLPTVPSLQLAPAVRREVAFLADLLLTSHLEERFSALHYLKAVA